MSVKTRILSIQLIEKLKNDPAFAEMAGIRFIETDKKQKDYSRSETEVNMDNQTIGVEVA